MCCTHLNALYHIFHELVCWVILTNKRFFTDFCTVCSVCFIEYTQSFCLYVHPLCCSFLICCLLLLFASRCKEQKIHLEWRGCQEVSPRQAARRLSARKLFRRHTGRAQAGKNAAFMIFRNITLLMKYGHRETAWYRHRW